MAAGTTFPLRFELPVREQDHEADLRRALATALTASAMAALRWERASARLRRVSIKDAMAGADVHLHKRAELINWLDDPGAQPLETLSPDRWKITDRSFEMQAVFTLDGSLLIRSAGGQDDIGPIWCS